MKSNSLQAHQGAVISRLYFGFEEFNISDPWHETGPDGRELTDEEARKVYGTENVENYIRDASAYIDAHGDEVRKLLEEHG